MDVFLLVCLQTDPQGNTSTSFGRATSLVFHIILFAEASALGLRGACWGHRHGCFLRFGTRTVYASWYRPLLGFELGSQPEMLIAGKSVGGQLMALKVGFLLVSL